MFGLIQSNGIVRIRNGTNLVAEWNDCFITQIDTKGQLFSKEKNLINKKKFIYTLEKYFIIAVR